MPTKAIVVTNYFFKFASVILYADCWSALPKPRFALTNAILPFERKDILKQLARVWRVTTIAMKQLTYNDIT